MTSIAVQLTGPGVGAIAVIALEGRGTSDVLKRVIDERIIQRLQAGKFARIDLLDPATRTPIDDALLVRVGEERYELHVHGGTAVVEAALHALEAAGAKKSSIDEASHDGFFGHPLHAEIVTALAAAPTLTGARLLAAQEGEGLGAWARRWQSWLPEKTGDDLWRLHSATQWLLDRSRTLDRLLHPARIAIVGPPNAGKSTLANALLGRPIAITSEIPGTTRDWVDAMATFEHGNSHVPVVLVDTAGVRDTEDVLEQRSIARTHEQAALADLVLLVFDGSRRPRPEELGFIRAYDPACLLVAASKADVGEAGIGELQAIWPGLLQFSAKTHRGLDAVMSAALITLDLARVNPGEPFAFNPRQQSILQELGLTTDLSRANTLLNALID